MLYQANALYETGLVEYSHPDFYAGVEQRQPSADPLFFHQWNLHNSGQGNGIVDADIDAPEAWAITRGASHAVIAILDSGIEWTHRDLSPNIAPGRQDFVADPPDDDPAPQAPGDFHGTAVAGLAAARGNNLLGISGVCPKCGLLPIRMLRGRTRAHHGEAIAYAAASGAWVINNSWGYTPTPTAADDVLDAITHVATTGRNGLGTVVVFAMANEHKDNCRTDALDLSAHPLAIGVTRSTNLDTIGEGGFGRCADLVAPTWRSEDGGTLGVTSTGLADGYIRDFGGTSAAAPLVAGTAGLLLSLNPRLTREEVQAILEHSADRIHNRKAKYSTLGRSQLYGAGRVNANRTLLPSVWVDPEGPTVVAGGTASIDVLGSAPFGVTSVELCFEEDGVRSACQVATGDSVALSRSFTVELGTRLPGAYTLVADVVSATGSAAPTDYPDRASSLGGTGVARTTVTVIP